MRVLITGAAGNLGSFLARHLAGGAFDLRLMTHSTPLPSDLVTQPNAGICQADLADPASLIPACRGVDCVVHFAGVLFAPRPERFLARTNTAYTQNLIDAAVAAKVRKFVLVSFPHVEGESTPDRPAGYRLNGAPESVHARTRLAAEQAMFRACDESGMVGIALRAGMIYGRGVLMIEAARWLLRHRLLGVWRRPTWIHLLSLPDFLTATERAIELPEAAGVYNLGDDVPTTLQEFLDVAADHWGHPRPWRMPEALILAAAIGCEAVGTIFRIPAPLTRDFIRIGMASYWADTERMRRDLLPRVVHPSFRDGLDCL